MMVAGPLVQFSNRISVMVRSSDVSVVFINDTIGGWRMVSNFWERSLPPPLPRPRSMPLPKSNSLTRYALVKQLFVAFQFRRLHFKSYSQAGAARFRLRLRENPI